MALSGKRPAPNYEVGMVIRPERIEQDKPEVTVYLATLHEAERMRGLDPVRGARSRRRDRARWHALRAQFDAVLGREVKDGPSQGQEPAAPSGG